MTTYISNTEKHYYGFIDGLRAIAVLMVLVFHLEPNYLSGGYIGVDVFFTISGFLITQILIEKKDLPYFQFLLARARRLVPAMALVITVIALLGIFFIALPTEINTLSKSIITASGYLSNVFFFLTANYFDSTKDNNMLLHTWSLSAEWQFYLLYPFIIYLFARGRFAFLCLSLLSVITLMAAQFYLSHDSDAVFYLTPFRAFEFSLGGLVFIMLNKNLLNLYMGKSKFLANLVVIFSIVTLLSLSLTYNKNTLFPGVSALWVSLTTCLILAMGLSRTAQLGALKIIDNQFMKYIGKISYSLYLWHWPLIIGVRMYQPEPNVKQIVIVGIASFVLADLTHRYFENRFRKNTIQNNWIAISLAIIPLSIGIIAYGVNKTSPELLNRLTEHERHLLSVQRWAKVPGKCVARHETHEYFDCVIGNVDGEPTMLVYGDSHAQMHVWALHEELSKQGKSARYLTKGGCPPFFGAVLEQTNLNRQACLELQNRFKNVLDTSPLINTVIVSARWSVYAGQKLLKDNAKNQFSDIEEQLRLVINYLKDSVERIVIMDSLPEAAAPAPELIVRNLQVGKELKTFKNQATNYEFLGNLQNEKVKVIDVEKILCRQNGECPFFLNGSQVLFDSNHLTVDASKYVLERSLFHSDLTD
ncbi:hypothetical protein BM527_13195 [Alteromonas sp. Mex14]|nr:hypothetical protein BM527_13195 [Alteromonas sp. Mex14]